MPVQQPSKMHLHLPALYLHVAKAGDTQPQYHTRIQRKAGGPDPLVNHKAIGFLINTGPDPVENHKATKPAFNVGPPSARQRNTT